MEEIKVEFLGIGDNDQIQYHKADIIKSCVLGSNFALSFYQVDYQAIANAAEGASSLSPQDTKLIPISKVVMDLASLDILIDELGRLKEKIQSSK